MEEAKAIITCDEIIAERDRLTVAAINKLNQIALTGSAMLVEGHQGLTLQHIFACWYSQGTPMPNSAPTPTSDLQERTSEF